MPCTFSVKTGTRAGMLLVAEAAVLPPVLATVMTILLTHIALVLLLATPAIVKSAPTAILPLLLLHLLMIELAPLHW